MFKFIKFVATFLGLCVMVGVTVALVGTFNGDAAVAVMNTDHYKANVAEIKTNITQSALLEEIGQYDFLYKNGTKKDLCMQAGVVAYGYQQLGDAVKYKAWKGAQKHDCAVAGMDLGE